MELRDSTITFLFLIFLSANCTRNKTSNYTIGFEGFHRVGPTNHTSQPYYTTPPPKRQPFTTIRAIQPKITILPNVRVTSKSPLSEKATKLPKFHYTTFKPSPTRRPPSTKPPKSKATHPTTKRPTVPTLPPSIYVKPNISKVILPPINSDTLTHRSPLVHQDEFLITTTMGPIANPSLWDFGLFYNHLKNFTAKAEHTKHPIYRPNKGDTFTYYYDISHYYKNAYKIPQNYKVQVSNIKNCATNTSKVICLPNTNALCLTNGTIMCVTHLSAAIPCEGGAKYCAITFLPCDVKYRTCLGNDKLYVGLPCVSKALLLPSSSDFYQHVTLSPIEYCVTSVVQPKRLYSAVGPLFSILMHSAKKQYEALSDNIFRYNNIMF